MFLGTGVAALSADVKKTTRERISAAETAVCVQLGDIDLMCDLLGQLSVGSDEDRTFVHAETGGHLVRVSILRELQRIASALEKLPPYPLVWANNAAGGVTNGTSIGPPLTITWKQSP